MKKAFVATILYSAALFVIITIIDYLVGIDEWLLKAIEWTIPSAIGYFYGYMHRQLRNK